jgi:hypothetical protein
MIPPPLEPPVVRVAYAQQSFKLMVCTPPESGTLKAPFEVVRCTENFRPFVSFSAGFLAGEPRCCNPGAAMKELLIEAPLPPLLRIMNIDDRALNFL